ncbi:MAG: RNA methyltransferase [Citromicrobium sp.]|nr:MAG: RNA methyltransferase [Citromicrobium sp.]
MSGSQTILRIAAKGDGVTQTGRHVAGAVTGDVVAESGAVTPGPHRVVPPCPHFAVGSQKGCGGCQLQHADEETLRTFVTERVTNAAAAQDIAVGELLPTHLSPPNTRRRATLHAQKIGKRAVIGFREARGHRIVDMRECHILRPELLALVPALRRLVSAHGGKAPIDIALTLADQGVDCAISGLELEGLDATQAVLDFARDHGLARLALDQGYGAESVWEPQPVTITLDGIAVGLPPSAFLQATKDGEDCLVGDARAFLNGAASVADLFAGLGTFSFALANPTRVLAVEAGRDAHLACKIAANAHAVPVEAMHRDLFRNPLQSDELGKFAGLLLDPPRAGAREQVAQIAASRAERVAYVSCNPASWAKDAKVLCDAGFRLETLRAVGQFRWSTHVELTSYFTR